MYRSISIARPWPAARKLRMVLSKLAPVLGLRNGRTNLSSQNSSHSPIGPEVLSPIAPELIQELLSHHTSVVASGQPNIYAPFCQDATELQSILFILLILLV